MHVTICSLLLALSSVAWAGPCEFPGPPPAGLAVRDGYTDFMLPSELKPFQEALPAVADMEVMQAMRSPDTMWYDETSMVFLYQDSIEVVTGARANCVGRKTGENNPGSPIHKLTNYFGPDYRFMFPFRKAAGTDNVGNVRVLNFWAPPKKNGKTMPVKYWRPTSRGHWYWTFPLGTLFGEVLYQKGPDGKWYVFEIRTRERYQDGWAVDQFRPFRSAEDMAEAVILRRPHWQQSTNLTRLINHLRNKNTLMKHRWESKAFGKVFPAIDGSLDLLPAIEDTQLIVELLTETPFRTMEGAIWKENGQLETYAPSSQGDFHVVPKGYEMGMIPVNEVSCNRCHSETSRRLSEFEFDIILYGEVWGEDRIFTWHLFEPNRYIWDTWDDTQGSRKPNSRLVQANLIKNEKPSSSDPDYKPLPNAFVPEKK